MTCHQTLVVRPCLTHGRVSQVSRSSWANKFVEAATEQTSGEGEDGGGWCALLPISGGQRKDTDSSSSVYCTISYFARHILVLAPEGIEPVRRQKGSPQRLAGARCVPVVTSTSLLRTAADANCVCSRRALLQQLYSFCDECRDTDSTSVHAITSLVGHALRDLADAMSETNCVCQTHYVDVGFDMIHCSHCDRWYHPECLGYTPLEAADLQTATEAVQLEWRCRQDKCPISL